MALTHDDHELVLLHNPRCSKSRAARALLEERGVPFRERRYLDDPLSRAELDDLARRLGLEPSRWMRRREAAWAAAGLGDDTHAAALLDALARHPTLLERPIAVRGRRALVARPPERVLELVSKGG